MIYYSTDNFALLADGISGDNKEIYFHFLKDTYLFKEHNQ